jgi:hypothetical protein
MKLEENKFLAVMFSISLGIIGTIGAFHMTRQVYDDVTITEKKLVRQRYSPEYVISAKSNDGKIYVFENKNSLLESKFNSPEIQSEIQIGKKYWIKTYGWTIDFLDCYENILDVQEK